MTPRKPGRPRLPAGEARDLILRVRVTPAEMAALQEFSRGSGVTLTEGVRWLLFGAPRRR
jgi:hypothetical protein